MKTTEKLVALKPRVGLPRCGRRHRGQLVLSIAGLAFAALLPSMAEAETLKEALTAAYLFNPTLKAARAQLRATDNEVSRAKSGYRPTITGTVQDGFEDTRVRTKSAPGYLPVYPNASLTPGTAVPVPLSGLGGSANGTYNPRSASVTLQQNVFDGFRTYNGVKGAEALVEAGREDLRTAEEAILLSAATAYMNVVRDQAIVNLRQNNVKVLSEQLRATEDRFKVGEVTRTDVSQAQSTLAGAQADMSIAQATLSTNRALFAQLIGHFPGTLRDPGPVTKLLPKSLAQAVATGESENPAILGAIFRERAQEHAVKQTKGQLLPSVTLNASYLKGAEASPSTLQTDDTRITGNVNIPIYEAGSVSAQIREAIEILSQRRQQIDEQREQVRANAYSAWGQLSSARGTVTAGQAAVESSKIALQGVQEEERVGQRTVLDVLNAQQTYLNAQVNLVSFRRDLVVASYSVLSAMGRLTAYDISLQAELYDPTRHYGEVKDAWYGWGASSESAEDSRVAPVQDPGRAAGGKSADGPAYTQKSHSNP